jgi:hypothetical protein
MHQLIFNPQILEHRGLIEFFSHNITGLPYIELVPVKDDRLPLLMDDDEVIATGIDDIISVVTPEKFTDTAQSAEAQKAKAAQDFEDIANIKIKSMDDVNRVMKKMTFQNQDEKSNKLKSLMLELQKNDNGDLEDNGNNYMGKMQEMLRKRNIKIEDPKIANATIDLDSSKTSVLRNNAGQKYDSNFKY